MAKQLKDILTGVKKSTVTPEKLGDKPGVDYDPKAGDERKWVAKHSVEKHEDRVGNTDDLYKSSINYDLNHTKEKRYGYKKGNDEKVYESTDHIETLKGIHSRHKSTIENMPKNASYGAMAHLIHKEHEARIMLKKHYGVDVPKPKHKQVLESKETEETKCNMTAEGTKCPVHGMTECSSVKKINEVITKKTSAGEIIKDFQKSKNPKFAGKSAEERKRQALGAYYSKHPEKSKTNEDLAVPLLGSHESDEAVDMVKAELRALANKAMHLVMAMPEGMHVEPWVQAKLAQAKEMVSSVHDYMIYGEHDKPEEDEQTAPYEGGIDMGGSPRNTFPGMNVDNALGMNV